MGSLGKSADSRRGVKATHGVTQPTADVERWPRCGARTRAGGQCGQPAVRSDRWPYGPRNGRCRFHGGLSTGPRTPEGRRRISDAAKAAVRAYYESLGAFALAEYDDRERRVAAIMAEGKTRARALYELRGGAEHVAELRRRRRYGLRW